MTRAVGSGGTADRVDILAEVATAPRVDALPGLDAVGPPGAAVDVAPVAAAERVVPGDVGGRGPWAPTRPARTRRQRFPCLRERRARSDERRGRADDGRPRLRKQPARSPACPSDRPPPAVGERRRRPIRPFLRSTRGARRGRNTRCSSRSHARRRAGGRWPWRCGRHRRGRSGPRRRTGGRSGRPRDCRRCHRAGGGRRRLGRSRRADCGGAGQRSHHDGAARRAVLTWVAGCRLLVRCCTGETTRERRRTCGPPRCRRRPDCRRAPHAPQSAARSWKPVEPQRNRAATQQRSPRQPGWGTPVDRWLDPTGRTYRQRRYTSASASRTGRRATEPLALGDRGGGLGTQIALGVTSCGVAGRRRLSRPSRPTREKRQRSPGPGGSRTRRVIERSSRRPAA